MKRLPYPAATAIAVTLCTIAFSLSAFASEGGKSSKDASKTAFGPGEHVIQLPPMWVPVNSHKTKARKTQYAPLTIFLTSKDGGMKKMCYDLPYLQQAFLFKLNTMDLRMNNRREISTESLDEALLNVAIQTTDTDTVKKIEVVSGTPHPKQTNQDMLDLCR